MKRLSVKRFIMMVLGVLCIGIAVSLFRETNFGTDPFTCMNLGISNFFNIQFGVYQLCVNIILFIIVLLYDKNHIGLGTILNMAGVGFISDFLVFIYNSIWGDHLSMVFRIILVIIAIIFSSLGVALYMVADLGISPYDAVGPMIEKATNGKLPFRWARVVSDIICVAIGFSFGSIVGISTVITAFFTGPLVQFFKVHVAEKI